MKQMPYFCVLSYEKLSENKSRDTVPLKFHLGPLCSTFEYDEDLLSELSSNHRILKFTPTNLHNFLL
jgi:hypothetical protein